MTWGYSSHSYPPRRQKISVLTKYSPSNCFEVIVLAISTSDEVSLNGIYCRTYATVMLCGRFEMSERCADKMGARNDW